MDTLVAVAFVAVLFLPMQLAEALLAAITVFVALLSTIGTLATAAAAVWAAATWKQQQFNLRAADRAAQLMGHLTRLPRLFEETARRSRKEMDREESFDQARLEAVWDDFETIIQATDDQIGIARAFFPKRIADQMEQIVTTLAAARDSATDFVQAWHARRLTPTDFTAKMRLASEHEKHFLHGTSPMLQRVETVRRLCMQISEDLTPIATVDFRKSPYAVQSATARPRRKGVPAKVSALADPSDPKPESDASPPGSTRPPSGPSGPSTH